MYVEAHLLFSIIWLMGSVMVWLKVIPFRHPLYIGILFYFLYLGLKLGCNLIVVVQLTPKKSNPILTFLPTPIPHVIFGNTLPPPPHRRLSRVIWMAPYPEKVQCRWAEAASRARPNLDCDSSAVQRPFAFLRASHAQTWTRSHKLPRKIEWRLKMIIYNFLKQFLK